MIDACTPETHAAIKSDPAAFAALAPGRTEVVDYGDGESEIQETRHCRCGSTLYRCVAVGGAS